MTSYVVSMDDSELLILSNRYRTLTKAREVKEPRAPNDPYIQELPVSDALKSAAGHLGACPYELEAIVKHAVGTQNEMVLKAFKDFVMKAKLALDEDELPLAATRDKVKKNRLYNEKILAEHALEVEKHKATLAKIKQDIEDANTNVTDHWRAIVDHTQRRLEQHKLVSKLRVWDRCVVEGIIQFFKDNKEHVSGKCPLRPHKDTIRCTDAGWKLLHDIDVEMVPLLVESIRGAYREWKGSFLDKHILTKADRSEIQKLVFHRMMNAPHMHHSRQWQLPRMDELVEQFCHPYYAWLDTAKNCHTDGADGIDRKDIYHYVVEHFRQAQWNVQMMQAEIAERNANSGWAHWGPGISRRAKAFGISHVFTEADPHEFDDDNNVVVDEDFEEPDA